jgi:hypothetical protein
VFGSGVIAKWYVYHGFLIVTISSGIIALPGFLNDPGSIATTLAQKLPEGSTFFLTYAVLQGFGAALVGFCKLSRWLCTT